MPDTESVELEASKIPFATDGLSQPSVYADYIRGAMLSSGVVKLNLVDNRVNALTNEVETIHVMTVITPVAQLRAWGKFLLDLADKHDPQLPVDAPAPDQPDA